MGSRGDTGACGPPVAQPAANVLLLSVFALLLGVFGWQGLTDDDGSLRPEQDHTITLSLSRELVDTGAYHTDFVYPLPAVVMKLALGSLGTHASSLVWMALMIAAALACVEAMARLLPAYDGRSRYAAPLLGAFAIVYCLRWDFRAVNANTVFLASVLWGFVLFGRGREIGGSALLAISVALKLYSAPLVGLLVVQRRWRAAAWTAVWLVVLFAAVPVLWFGPSDAAALTGRWIDRLIGSGSLVSAGQVTAYNVSLLRVVGGVLGEAGQAPSSAALWLSRGVGLVFAGGVAAWLVLAARRAGPGSLDAQALTGIGLTLAAMLILSPIAQPHHGVVLWPLASVAARVALDPAAERAKRWQTGGLLALAAALLVAMPSGFGKAVALNGAAVLLAMAAAGGARSGRFAAPHSPS